MMMMMMLSKKQLFALFWALFASLLVAFVACEVEKYTTVSNEHKIVVDKLPTDPLIDVMVDDVQVKGKYYEDTIKAADYTQERKDFDKKLIKVLTEFGYNFANDIVIKNSYTVVVGPKYTAKLTGLIATYLPEFLRTVKASGPPVKDGFIGDAITIWKTITQDILVDEKKKSKLVIPTDGQDFMKKLRKFMDVTQETVNFSPVGIYIDWRTATYNGQTLSEYAAPFIVYLQEKGYKKHIGIMDGLMSIVAKIKPSSDAH